MPQGSVRALLALIFSGTTAALFLMQVPMPSELLLLNGVVVAYYFAERAQAAPPLPEPVDLPEPYLGDNN